MFNSFRSKLIGGFTAAAMAVGSAFNPVVAHADDAQVAELTQPAQGKPVILRVGPKFSLSAADGIASVLRDEGCPVTVTSEGGFPNSLTVDVEGHRKFRTKSVGSAGSLALDWCLGRS